MNIASATSTACLAALLLAGCASCPPVPSETAQPPAASSEPSTPSVSTARPDPFCESIEAAPPVDTAQLTEQALRSSVPFTLGSSKAEVLAAYDQFFDDFRQAPDPPDEPDDGPTPTPHGYELSGRERAPEPPRSCARSHELESFRFQDLGVWYFFNHEERVATIRIDPPFEGMFQGVKLGESRQTVVDRLGEPFRIFEWGGDHAHVFRLPSGESLRVDIEPSSQTVVRMFD